MIIQNILHSATHLATIDLEVDNEFPDASVTPVQFRSVQHMQGFPESPVNISGQIQAGRCGLYEIVATAELIVDPEVPSLAFLRLVSPGLNLDPSDLTSDGEPGALTDRDTRVCTISRTLFLHAGQVAGIYLYQSSGAMRLLFSSNQRNQLSVRFLG